MKLMRWIVGLLCVTMLAQGTALGAEGAKPWQVRIGLFATYDDNYNYSETDALDSFGIRLEPEFLLNVMGERTVLSVGYKPSAVYWTDREDDDTDFDHDLYVALTHAVSRRLRISLQNNLRRSEEPELIQEGNIVRQNGDYWWDSLGADVSVMLAEKLNLDLSGRYAGLRYDDDALEAAGIRLNSDTLGAGAGLWFKATPKTSLGLQAAYEDQAYEHKDYGDRGSKSVKGGVGLVQTFNPNVTLNADAGYQQRDFNSAIADTGESPYASLQVRVMPTPRTQITVGGGHQLDTTDAYPYTAQRHSEVLAAMSYAITEKLTLSASGSYGVGEYDQDERLPVAYAGGDATETMILASVGLAFAMTRNHEFDVGYDFKDFDTDVVDSAVSTRVPYTRQVARAGWRMSF